MTEWQAVYGPYDSHAEAFRAHEHATGDDQPDLRIIGTFTADELLAAADLAPSAADLIHDNRCDGNCLTAGSPVDECACRCRGTYHGALATAPVYARTWEPA
jgi:hypothetical protein